MVSFKYAIAIVLLAYFWRLRKPLIHKVRVTADKFLAPEVSSGSHPEVKTKNWLEERVG
ncbi:MAG: hypothetical protein WBM44_06215 [Waterburya sp.]